jgi:hypothetical protein
MKYGIASSKKRKIKKKLNSTYPLSFSQGVIFPKQQPDEKGQK